MRDCGVSGRKDPARARAAIGLPNIGKADQSAYHAKLAARNGAHRRRAPLGAPRRSISPSSPPAATMWSLEFGLAPWDKVAGLLVVREAGGIVSDIAGQPYVMGGPSVLASNFVLRDPMVEILSGA